MDDRTEPSSDSHSAQDTHLIDKSGWDGKRRSAQAYDPGSIAHRKALVEVDRILWSDGPLTAHEISALLPRNDGRNVCARLRELQSLGRAKIVGERVNASTGKTAAIWDAVAPGQETFCIPKKPSRKAIEVENALLREENHLLRQRFAIYEK